MRERHRRGRPVRLPYFFSLFFSLESLTKISFPIDSFLRGQRKNSCKGEKKRVRGRRRESLASSSFATDCLLFSPKAKPPLCATSQNDD